MTWKDVVRNSFNKIEPTSKFYFLTVYILPKIENLSENAPIIFFGFFSIAFPLLWQSNFKAPFIHQWVEWGLMGIGVLALLLYKKV